MLNIALNTSTQTHWGKHAIVTNSVLFLLPIFSLLTLSLSCLRAFQIAILVLVRAMIIPEASWFLPLTNSVSESFSESAYQNPKSSQESNVETISEKLQKIATERGRVSFLHQCVVAHAPLDGTLDS